MGFEFNKLSVLIVEDTGVISKLIESVLETLGVKTIFTAPNGERGFEIFCDKKPDIVLTDWDMEPVDGITLIKQIRTNPKSPHQTVPIIITTGFSALERVAEARDSGATEFLVKPFSAAGLTRRIAYVINRPRDFIKAENYFGPDRRRRVIESYQGPERRAQNQTQTTTGHAS